MAHRYARKRQDPIEKHRETGGVGCSTQATAIDSFADNYQFSNATLITKGMAPWNAVALGEIDEVIQRLHERPCPYSDEAWWEEWCALAARLEGLARLRAERGVLGALSLLR